MNNNLHLNATNSVFGIIALTVFIIAYLLVILEEITDLKKSKPILLASGIIWIIVAVIAKQQNLLSFASLAVK